MTPTELDGQQVMEAARAHLEADAVATLQDANRRSLSCALAAVRTEKRRTFTLANTMLTQSPTKED